MTIERGGRPPETAPDNRLEGEFRILILGLLKENTEGEKPASLFAVDPDNSDDYNREDGSGELKLSHTGDLQIKQVEKGVIFWKVVSGLPDRLKRRLRLDDDSVQAVAEYQKRRDAADSRRKKERNYTAHSESRADNKELELRYFKLEQLRLKPVDDADKLISRVMMHGHIRSSSNINIESTVGQTEFCRTWRKKCGLLPLPCVPPKELFTLLYPGRSFPAEVDEDGDFWYLRALADDLVVNDLGKSTSFAIRGLIPDFGQEGSIYVMDWEEENHDTVNRAGNKSLQTSAYSSPLLQELGIAKEGVVGISRKEIDNALWEGDPGDHIKTAKHKSIIDKIGFKSEGYELRCIRQEEYSLLAGNKKWGKHKLFTHFDNYVLDAEKKKDRSGLCGGDVRLGGSSFVFFADREKKEDDLAVRLVLARV